MVTNREMSRTTFRSRVPCHSRRSEIPDSLLTQYAMKSHHAAAIAIVAWYLMIPPVGIDNMVDARAPLSQWRKGVSFKSEKACADSLKDAIQNPMTPAEYQAATQATRKRKAKMHPLSMAEMTSERRSRDVLRATTHVSRGNSPAKSVYVSLAPTLRSPVAASSAGATFFGLGSIRARLTVIVPPASAIFIPSASMAIIVPVRRLNRLLKTPLRTAARVFRRRLRKRPAAGRIRGSG